MLKSHECRAVENAEVDILVTEDDVFLRLYMTKLLEASGYRVTAAASGGDALKLLKAGFRPRLLFTDVVMAGGMTGVQLAEKARKMLPDINILLTSGYTAMLEDEQLPPGARLLPKPFRRKDCLEAVRVVLGGA